MPQAAQVGAIYRSSQDLLDSDLPALSVVLDARGYAIQRDTDGSWYSVASVSSSDLVGAYTLVHLPAARLPVTTGSVVITRGGTPFMRRWDVGADERSRPDRWIGPDGATLDDADLRRLGVARTWDAGAAEQADDVTPAAPATPVTPAPSNGRPDGRRATRPVPRH